MSDETRAPDSVKAAYEATDDYDVRVRTHELYSVAEGSWQEWLVAQLPREGVRAVLDLGCGTGGILRMIAAAGIGERWVGVDQSEAMVQKAQRLADEAGLAVEFRQGDILDPPRNDERFDVICACHMLYHVPDIDTAIARCAQRLAPGGAFVATTNSRDTMSPYGEQIWSALAERFPRVRHDAASHVRFSLENGAEFLLRHFDRIELRVRRDAFRFPDPAPWAAYLKSGRQLMLAKGHTDEEWAEVSAMIDDLAREQFAGGPLVVPKVAGVFLCRGAAG
jgi:2-polyprenyl-3-methyl-5-hydroxy-6-metoxy-1,4-benzoquinol methylase